ncbi:cobyrinate a,c-diamide synthase [Rhizobium sp. TRM95111]|uniref:cobyrinate a,c-diamide synthase n=1 Tax=Rhizobium alarense TaxID=2846851 RepID=UPI001F44F15C|nr:cobyrinate a,c-diamide synthase [Rhizobium alarense]MCF3640873.1 cobyrinate a,c-diamide synthase [Rhizobium alarense]
MSGFLIAAPASGSGKTTVTLGLLRLLADRGLAVASGKAGPDFIDPAFHAAATRGTCINLDPWAMRPSLLSALAAAEPEALLLVEAMMGLHDGAADGRGTPADLAAMLGLPVVLVVDCAKLSQSVAAIAHGYASLRSDITVAGLILNRVASARHEAMLRGALDRLGMPVLGIVPCDTALALPERHLGLVQAAEHGGLESFIAGAARIMAETCDVEALLAVAATAAPQSSAAPVRRMPPPGQVVAVARDTAFAFAYEHLLEGWRRQGAEIVPFSPLADEAPALRADAVYLPGGYPELHACTLANAARFGAAMHAAAGRGARIYGECGGYMVLGEGLIAADGTRHAMLGLLPLVTSFAERRRHLGYRRLRPRPGSGFAGLLNAHEFHYSTIVSEGAAERVFDTCDSEGNDLGAAGLRCGTVIGSYMHLIDLSGDDA